MNTVNRAVVIVKPKQPFASWVNSHRAADEHPVDLELIQDDCRSYLIDDIAFREDADVAVLHFYPVFFEDQLSEWYAEEELWPRLRDYVTFREWFHVEVHSIVFDLGSLPLTVEEF